MPAIWLQPLDILAPSFYSDGFMASARKPCSAATTCAPSPIAPPTRLTEPERTSPTANTPGTEVSSGDACCPSFCLHCVPVTTQPPRSTITPQPSSQPVAGSAPTNRKRLRMSMPLSSPDSRLRQRTRSSEAPAPAHASERAPRRTFERDHLGVEYKLDVRRGLDALDQIARHARAKAA